MLRILAFIALGGTITLHLLALSNSQVFNTWGVRFTIATIVLFIVSIVGGIFGWLLRQTREIEEAKASGRLRAALILDRRQTGTFINDNPQIEFSLLVDNPDGTAFTTNARGVVQLIDVHTIDRGNIIAVAHPSPEYGDVYIVDSAPPTPSRPLTDEAAKSARPLPKRAEVPTENRRAQGSLKIPLYLIAFFGGAIGAPFLATPKALDYARLILRGETEQVKYVDHPKLFEVDHLKASLAALIAENNHNELFSLHIRDIRLDAKAPEDFGADTAYELRIQDHVVQSKDQTIVPPPTLERGRFSVEDVDWDAVFEGIETARDVVLAHGATEAELHLIHVSADDKNPVPIEIRLTFGTDFQARTVRMDAQGQLHPSEAFALLPEDVQATYLHDPEPLQEAFEAIGEHVSLEKIVGVSHHGNWMSVEAFVDRKNGRNRSVTVDFRKGHVSNIGNVRASTAKEEELFELDDVDWNAVLQIIEKGKEILAELGESDMEFTHLVVRSSRVMVVGTYELGARIYFRNEAAEGASIQVNRKGETQRVFTP